MHASAPAFSSSASLGLSGPTKVILAILIAVLALIGTAFAFGPAVLTLAALTLVPLMFAVFIAISRP